MVLGVRVHGPNVVDADVKLDETFRAVPVPEKLGIPVLYRVQSGTGGEEIWSLTKILDLRADSVDVFFAFSSEAARDRRDGVREWGWLIDNGYVILADDVFAALVCLVKVNDIAISYAL